MNLSTRLAGTAAAAAATLALAVGSFGLAAPANADPMVDPSVTSSPSTAPSSTTPAPSTTTPTPSTTTTAKPKPKKKAKKAKKRPKAKVSNYKRLTAKAKRVANKVRNDWRKVKRIGGWRAGSRYSGDHPAGRAIDVMIPRWKKNAKLGYSIAKYLAKKKNAKKYKIHYVIFRQKIWTVQNPHWRKMANRGGATANHFDHVHISVKR